MGKFSRAFKDAKAAFKVSVNSYKNEMACKRNLDKILDAYAILPEYVRGGNFKEFVLSEIELFEMVFGTAYLRKSELEIVRQPIPCESDELSCEDCCIDTDEDSVTVDEEQHE